MKSCRRQHALKQREDEVDSLVMNKALPLVPVVSLTPIASDSMVSKTNHNYFANDRVSSNESKMVDNIIPQSKKVPLPLTAVSSSAKRIGIQVRVNYCKSNSAQVSDDRVGFVNSSYALSSSVSCTRRNSMVTEENTTESVKEEPDTEHCTRSRTSSTAIFSDASEKDDSAGTIKLSPEELENTPHELKMLPKNRASIYCEDCQLTFALTDYKCNVESGITRNYRCALRNCDFRCSDDKQLLPHMTEKHEVMSEGELDEVKSFFIAESINKNCTDGNLGCKSVSDRCAEQNGKGNENVAEPVDNKGSKNQAASNTRKGLACASKLRKKVISSEKNPLTSCEKQIKSKNEPLNNSLALTNRLNKMTTENAAAAKLTNSSKNVTSQLMENLKKRKKNSTENKCKFVRKRKSASVEDSNLVNGLPSSSDEENEMKVTVATSKPNYDTPLRKQNSFSTETRSDKSLNKPAGCQNDLSPSSSAPGKL